MSQPAIELDNVNKWFGTFHVLRDINLTVRAGEKVVICGPSGSGKSTVVRCINRLEQHQSGTIRVDGVELTDDPRSVASIRSEVGMVFQQFNLFPHLTVLENLTLGPIRARGLPRKEARERAMHYLERVHIPEQADKRPGQLSGGQQQRVAIARSLLFSPAVIFADEPTGNLDSASAEQLWSLLASLAEQQQITVIMVTHEPSAASHCKRTYLLRDGVVSGTIETGAMDATDIAAEYQRLSRSA